MTEPDMHIVVVDRIEGDTAVLEADGGTMEVSAQWLPTGTREGSVLRVAVAREGDVSRIVLTLDAEARAAREAEIQVLRESIPEGPDGDIAL